MHLHHDHIGGHSETHEHAHTHEHEHPHSHDHLHEEGQEHTHSHDCGGQCQSCESQCSHTPMEELLALVKYMVGHNAAHARELQSLPCSWKMPEATPPMSR